MDTKTCTRCGETKPFEEFHRNRSTSDGRAKRCKTCACALQKERYEIAGDAGRAKRKTSRLHALGTYLEKERERQRRRRAAFRARAVDVRKAMGCQKCDETHPATLQFHHLDPSTKSFSINRAVMKCRSWDEIESEIEKCIVLCANCHAKLHYEERRGSN